MERQAFQVQAEQEEMGKGESEPFIRTLLGKIMDVHGLSARELSRRWGVAEGTVSKLLSGDQQDVTLEQARKLVAAFGINPKVLFRDPDPENGAE